MSREAQGAWRRKQQDRRISMCSTLFFVVYMTVLLGCVVMGIQAKPEDAIWAAIGGSMFLGLMLLAAIVGGIRLGQWLVRRIRTLYWRIRKSPYF